MSMSIQQQKIRQLQTKLYGLTLLFLHFTLFITLNVILFSLDPHWHFGFDLLLDQICLSEALHTNVLVPIFSLACK